MSNRRRVAAVPKAAPPPPSGINGIASPPATADELLESMSSIDPMEAVDLLSNELSQAHRQHAMDQLVIQRMAAFIRANFPKAEAAPAPDDGDDSAGVEEATP